MFFLLTTAAGSALWAVKLEEQKALVEDGIAVGAEEQRQPTYSDEPNSV
jgi:hypothetical protein